jgi:hypothetical protein
MDKQKGQEPAEALKRTLLEQYDLEHSADYRAGYEDGRLKGYDVGFRFGRDSARAAAAQEAPAPTGHPIYLVAAGFTNEAGELYERHEGRPPPLCDYEGPLYAAPAPTPGLEMLLREALRDAWAGFVNLGGDMESGPLRQQMSKHAQRANAVLEATEDAAPALLAQHEPPTDGAHERAVHLLRQWSIDARISLAKPYYSNGAFAQDCSDLADWLAAAPVPAPAEPDSWRIRDTEIWTTRRETVANWRAVGFDVVPLYTVPAPAEPKP